MRSIGERVALLRREQGLSARALARAAQLSDGAIRRLESNPDAVPREDTIARIAAVLGLSASELRTYEHKSDTKRVESAPSLVAPEPTTDQLQALADQIEALCIRIDTIEAEVRSGALRRGEPLSSPAQNLVPLCAWPLRGRVRTGEAVEELPGTETREAPADLAGPERYLLEVLGEGMTPLGVRDGALLAVEPAEGFRFARGDHVVAMIDGDHATLKRFVRNKLLLNDGEARRTVWLAPQSLDFDVQEYDAARVVVRARVLAACNPGDRWAAFG